MARYNSTALYALPLSTFDHGKRLVLASRLPVEQNIEICSVFAEGANGVTIDQRRGSIATPASLEVACGGDADSSWTLGPYGVAVLWPRHTSRVDTVNVHI